VPQGIQDNFGYGRDTFWSSPSSAIAVSTIADHRPGTRLPKYEGEQTKIVHEMQVAESIQRELSGDAKSRP
jgi:hypothetical protein